MGIITISYRFQNGCIALCIYLTCLLLSNCSGVRSFNNLKRTKSSFGQTELGPGQNVNSFEHRVV